MKRIIVIFILSTCIGSFSTHPTETVSDEIEERLTLTPSQRDKLEKFRKVVADILEDDYERSDEYLLGYLQNRQWKIYPAKQMLKIAKNWKKTHNIEELSKTDFLPEMLIRFPVRLEGHDEKGCPITEIPFGDWDVAGYILNQEFVRDGVVNVLKHTWQMYGKMELRNRNSFPKCHQTRAIQSLLNYNVSHTSEVNSINACVQMMKDLVNYFPSVIYAADLIDVPESFISYFEIFKTTVSDEVYGKYKMYKRGSEDWTKNLDNTFDVDRRRKLSGKTE